MKAGQKEAPHVHALNAVVMHKMCGDIKDQATIRKKTNFSMFQFDSEDELLMSVYI